jgi:cytochrome P450
MFGPELSADPGVVSLVDRLLDRIEAKGQFDAIADFAAAIPVEVIGNLPSVPQAERGPLPLATK